VVSERETLKALHDGASIARFGDGELKLMYGRRCVSQKAVPGIMEELQDVIYNAGRHCLVGIPRICDGAPKNPIWLRYAAKFLPFLHETATYYSAFISRPDSAPDIDTVDYWRSVVSLWAGKRVALVANGVRSLTPQFLLDTGSTDVEFVECSYAHSYEQIDELFEKVMDTRSHRVILCAGPTATCLADRIASAGRQALDLGHVGMYLNKGKL
jgi:hypothetical protein